MCVGPEQRLFAAHEDIISSSPFFAAICRGQFLESTSKRVNLPEDIPEIFSSVLEYLYKGDYYPRLLHNKRRNTWELEDTEARSGGRGAVESTVYHAASQQVILKDTLLYCTAERYGLDELKRLALRKQGLQSGIQCSTILASARYAYANTPDNDSKLRAHYLALIIRSRSTFKRSGTMQMEMEAGGKLYDDTFGACPRRVCAYNCVQVLGLVCSYVQPHGRSLPLLFASAPRIFTNTSTRTTSPRSQNPLARGPRKPANVSLVLLHACGCRTTSFTSSLFQGYPALSVDVYYRANQRLDCSGVRRRKGLS